MILRQSQFDLTSTGLLELSLAKEKRSQMRQELKNQTAKNVKYWKEVK